LSVRELPIGSAEQIFGPFQVHARRDRLHNPDH
jgi:hypothetical protein